MVVLRLFVLLLAASTLFGDEQERFVCNTIQPGCSNVCFDVFAPVSVLRLWVFHFLLLCVPHVMFATYVMHQILSNPNDGAVHSDQSRGDDPFTLEKSSASGEVSLNKAPLPEGGAPRFYCSYLLVVILRILLEVVFGGGQFLLFGLSIPKTFLCHEAPCTSGVECYISRPTEKSLMLNIMLAVTSSSVLLSLIDVVCTMEAMVRWWRTSEMLVEELSKAEQSSVFTTTEDTDGLSSRRTSPSGCSKKEQHADDGSFHPPANEKHLSRSDTTPELSPTSVSKPAPTHAVHLKPPMVASCSEGVNHEAVRRPGQHAVTPSQQPDSNRSTRDKREWV